ncbi:MAG: DUF2171 domain-containing protein [Myxococcaceae bacterium]
MRGQKDVQGSNGGIWHAKYWKENEHGMAWGRVKDALRRDWEQTKKDLGVKSARELHQNVGDTVRQAAGKEVIPVADLPNPRPSSDWANVEPALQYGVGAQREYGQKYNEWDDQLENRLSTEWDSSKTGRSFDDVKPYVRKGWEGMRLSPAELAPKIQPGLPVVCSENGQFGSVDHLEGDSIKLKKDDQGVHHYIPVEWVTFVDDKVHVDRPGRQAMQEWSTDPF